MQVRVYTNLCLILAVCHLTLSVGPNIICFYDASSEEREGLAHFDITDLENALEFCTHVIYGYAGINSDSLQLTSVNTERDIRNKHYEKITSLKSKYPLIKFLLSVGGDKDLKNLDKYIQLLEAGREQQKVFIESVLYLIRCFKFDGFDLAFPFAHNKTQGIHIKNDVEQTRNSIRNLIVKKNNTTPTSKDYNVTDHKQLFTDLVQDLKTAFKPHDLMLTLTVLPNVNASMHFNATSLVDHLDFINLLTFDFTTPHSDPKEATYTAALYSVHVQGNRKIQHSIDYQVKYWTLKRIPRSKINVGIATYGRSWKMTIDSNRDGFPIINATDGPAPAGYLSKTPGLLIWAEICSLLPNSLNFNTTGPEAPLTSFVDPHQKFLTYAFRPPDANGERGMWLSYDDPYIAASKAAYVKRRHLGGVALYDVSLDDFHGICNGDTFPMLRYIKYTFL